MKQKLFNAISLALIFTMLFTSIALADNLQSDTDGIVPVEDDTTLAFGNVCAGQTYTQNVIFAAKRNGSYGNSQVWANGTTVTVAAGTVTGNGLSASVGDNAIVLPSEWDDAGNNALSTDTALATITLIPVATGTGSVLFSGSGSGSGGGTTTRSQTINVSWTVINCDTTSPVITLNVTGTLGNNGWYTSNVDVSWTVSDPESTVTSTTGCGASTVSTDTAGVTFTCSASSAGGTNSQSVTVKRDATVPLISGVASPAPNAAGWNNTDVAVDFSCSDVTSGVVSCGPDTTLSNNGADQSATGNAVDDAGNIASTTVSNIDIDKELPTITASVPVANSNGWYNGPVTATFACSDVYSGVASCEPEHQFTGEGAQSYTGHASDKADNQNSTNVSVNIDKTAPVIALVSRTPANPNGWNNGDVALEWSCTDVGGSGVVASTITKTVSSEGTSQSESATCEDLAGNTSSNTQTGINIDKTAPSITAQRDTVANSFGWNNTDVASSYSASDALSGLASPATGSFNFTSQGAGQSHTFTVTDLAGNSASATVNDVNIDKTAPSIGGAPDRAPNSNGWYNADVTVSFTCSDALSGVATCTAPSLVGEGADQSVSGEVTDKAGNTAAAMVSGINIDKTKPTISAAATTPANGNGWYNNDVTVEFTCSDPLSGFALDACPADEILSAEGAAVASTAQIVTDLAGNTSDESNVVTVKIDKTAPVASASASPAANANSWNNTNVTVSFSGTDGLSGVDSCSAAVVLSGEGAGQSASGTCADNAGNVSTPATASNINIDKTAPSVSLVSGPANGGTYYFGFVPAAPTCSASDALSGLDGSCTVGGYSAAVGTHTVSAGATDKAGNSASASATYSVSAWTINGFYQPVDMGGVWNTVRNGSTVPLKFEIFAGPTELTNTSYVQSLQAYQISCTAGGSEDPIETVSTGSTSLRYDATSGQFIFNWQTPRRTGNCYKVVMTALDGSDIEAFFKLK